MDNLNRWFTIPKTSKKIPMCVWNNFAISPEYPLF